MTCLRVYHHPVDLLDAQPVQDVWHERLEAHILDASDALGAQEIVVRRVTTGLALACKKKKGKITISHSIAKTQPGVPYEHCRRDTW